MSFLPRKAKENAVNATRTPEVTVNIASFMPKYERHNMWPLVSKIISFSLTVVSSDSTNVPKVRSMLDYWSDGVMDMLFLPILQYSNTQGFRSGEPLSVSVNNGFIACSYLFWTRMICGSNSKQ